MKKWFVFILVVALAWVAMEILRLPPPSEATPSGMTGVVFRDYNANGVRDAHEPGVPNVTVTAYPASATGSTGSVSTTTATDGSFSLATGSGSWRIEVTGLPPYLFDGAAGSTTVVFADDGASQVNIGVNNPNEYVGSNIRLATSIYYHADRSGSNRALLTFDYNAGCVDANLDGSCDNGDPNGFDTPAPSVEATQTDIGTTWGLAYDRNTDALYAAAFMKRHTKFRNHGETGLIFRILHGVTTVYADLSAQTGTDPHVQYNSATNECVGGLGTTWPSQSGDEVDCWDHDPDSWDQVGRIGFGDLDISDDLSTLWTINLFTKELYQIPITTTGLPLGIADITTYSLPLTAPCQSSDDLRPFALAFHEDKVYIGMTCTAEASQNRNELQAFVYSTDAGAPGTFTLELSIPLTYNRSYALDANQDSDADWNPWSPTFAHLQSPQFNSGEVAYPQPWLTDIEFDGEDMLLGIQDRYGSQMGFRRFSTDPTDNTMYSGDSAGDILKACSDGAGGWTLENNGSCGGHTTGGANNNQGPGGGEFYYQEHYPYHTETSMAGLVNVPGRGEVVEDAYDPIYDTNQFFDGGILWLDNTTGQRNRAYRIYDTSPGGTNPGDGTFAKGNGLGDLEYLSAPAPLEVGNRLWCDTGVGGVGAENGVQDPGESVVGGATVTLECDTDGNPGNGYEATASTTTDANGQYLFKDNTGDINGANGWPTAAWDSSIHIIPRNAQCRIKIDPNQLAIINSCGAGVNSPTVADNGGSDPGADKRDSDGVANVDGAGNIGVVFTTGGHGQNNHDLDFGFKQLQTGSLGDFVWNDADADGVQDAGETGIPNVTVELYTNSSCSGTAAQSTTTNSSGNYSFTNLAPGTYSVKFVTPSGYALSPANQGDDTTDSDPDPATGCTGAINLSAGEDDATWDAGLYPNQDWGDAPDTYGTTAATNGPTHVITPGLHLGNTIDAESNGQPTVNADGDDTNKVDDEDGVDIADQFEISNADAGFVRRWTISVTVTSTTTANLYGWIDFDGNGVFDADEGAVTSVNNGDTTATLAWTVPNDVTAGDTYARFRLTTAANVGPTGPAPDGEVEDYPLTIRDFKAGVAQCNDAFYQTRANPDNNYRFRFDQLDFSTDPIGETPHDSGPPPIVQDLTAGVQDLNAIGFNIQDGYIYAMTWDSNEPAPRKSLLARINPNTGGFQILGEVLAENALTFQGNAIAQGDPLVAQNVLNAGDVDRNEKFYVGSSNANASANTQLAVIDLRAMTFHVLPLTEDGSPGHLATADFAFNPQDGNIYAVRYSPTRLIKIDPTTGVITRKLLQDSVPHQQGGAVFDQSGNLYALINTDAAGTGPYQVYRIDVSDATPALEPVGTGSEPAVVNDGTGCLISRDRGDLPSPYATLDQDGGPSHVLLDADFDGQIDLFLGTEIDADSDGFVDGVDDTGNATDDDQPVGEGTGNGDDEDGVIIPQFTPGQTVSVPVTVTNTSAITATLYGFMDYNGDGDFADTGEAITATVAPGANDSVVTLPFPVPANAVVNQPVGLRIRLSTDATLGSGGAAPDGEVEDYLATIVAPSMLIDKDTTTPTVYAGQQVTYTIAVSNTGLDAATEVTISDTLPSGFTYASTATITQTNASRTNPVSPSAGDAVPTWGHWTIHAGGAVTITFLADTAPSLTPGTYDNTAYAVASNYPLINDDGTQGQDEDTPSDQDPENDEDVTVSSLIDLSLSKTVTPTHPQVGENVTFTITVTNSGPSHATGVVISDTLPSGYTYVSDDSGGSYNHTNGEWSVGALNAAASTALHITATVNASGAYTNTAEVKAADQTDHDSTPNNHDPNEDDQDSATVTPEHPAIGVAKRVHHVTDNGDGTYTVVYTLRVENLGDVTLSDVQVTDDLSQTFAGITVNSAAPTSSDFTVNSGYDGSTDISLLAGTDVLNVGASGVITLTAMVTPGTNRGPFHNQAVATGKTPQGTTVQDTSDNHVDPDSSGNGDAGDPGEDDPTPVSFDPAGFIYDEDTGEILSGGSITVDGPGQVTITQDGSDGTYRFYTDGTPGVYTMTVTPPPGYQLSPTCTSQDPPPLDPTGQPDPYELGSDDGDDNGYLDDHTCANNPYYLTFNLEPGDPEIALNNLPMSQLRGSLGDLVWWDIDRDGVQDPGEPGIPNVALSLSGTASAHTTTDASGVYTFANLVAGTYTVTVDTSNFTSGPLQDWEASPQNVGDDTTDSDGDPTTHNAGVTLNAGEINRTIDFGFTITTSYTLTKQLNTHDPVRVGAPISFTIRITNTGKSWLATLPLEDTYNTGYLTYGNNGQYAQPDSDDHNNDGTITWADALDGNPLAPGLSRTVVVTFTTKADTTSLPGGKTTNTARAHDGTADPDGPGGPLGALESLPAATDQDDVTIQNPTGIELGSFHAEGGDDGAVLLTWRTVNESRIIGFRVWRAIELPTGNFTAPLQVAFIPAQHAGITTGDAYRFEDPLVRRPAHYRYWLEILYQNGSAYHLGPTETWLLPSTQPHAMP